MNSVTTTDNDATNGKKNTTLTIGVSPDYVPSWGHWETIREFLQNAMDAHDEGHTMTISRGTGDKKTVRVTNEGVTLPRKALLIGFSSKRGSSARGKFGEGLNLALLVACRLGLPVQIRTGDEMWTPFIEGDPAFGGAETLKIKIRQQPKFVNEVEVQIHGVDDESWNAIQSRLLDVQGLPKTKLDPSTVITLGPNRILKDPKFARKIYNRGIYVCAASEDFSYGYDLADIELDRDRKMADPYSLRSQITHVLKRALADSKLDPSTVYQMMGCGGGEAKIIELEYEGSWRGADTLTNAVTAEFKKQHGVDAVPVADMTKSMEAAHYGIKGAVVPKAILRLVESQEGSYEKKKDSKANEAKKIYAKFDLSQEEVGNFVWVADKALVALAKLTPNRPEINVVDFYSDTLHGTYSAQNGVRIAKKDLSNRKELLITLVHELGHAIGGADGSVEHRENCDKLWAEIVCA